MVGTRRTGEHSVNSTNHRLPPREWGGRDGGHGGTSEPRDDLPPQDGRVGVVTLGSAEYAEFQQFQLMTAREREQFRAFQRFMASKEPPRVETAHQERVEEPDEEHVERSPPLMQAARAAARAPQPEEVQGKIFERFLSTGPPKFKGLGDPIKAGNWLMEVEKILKRIACPRAFWVSNASFQLKDDAEFWWQSVERKFEGREQDLTWETFVQEFHGKYFTAYAKAEKKVELLSLKQGDIKIPAYDAIFPELSRFAPELVVTEEDKMFLFLKGMDPDLQVLVRGLRCFSLPDMVERAANIERGLMIQREAEPKRPRETPTVSHGGGSGCTFKKNKSKPASTYSHSGSVQSRTL
ncbi:hypothetical protein Dimus_039445 [Dionaea muscipula]